MAKASIHDVAKYIFEKLGKETITQMSLYKLLWFCQGWHYAEEEKALFKEKFVAWKYGPIPIDLWTLYKGNIHLGETDFIGNSENVSSESKSVVDTVLEHYGNCSSSVLVELSHKCTPWINAYKIAKSKGTFVTIRNKDVKSFFCGLKRKVLNESQ